MKISIARNKQFIKDRIKLSQQRKVDPKWVEQSSSLTFPIEVKNWELPPGAFGDLSSGSW